MGMLRHRGFTLIELLVVFAIAALLVSVVPFAYGRMQESAQYRNVLRTILSDMRSARQQARLQGTEVRFMLDLQTRRYGIEGAVFKEVPAPVQVRATVAGIETAGQRFAAIRFLPDGGATGGSIDVFRSSGQGTRLQVDWMSGRVSVESLQR